MSLSHIFPLVKSLFLLHHIFSFPKLAGSLLQISLGFAASYIAIALFGAAATDLSHHPLHAQQEKLVLGFLLENINFSIFSSILNVTAETGRYNSVFPWCHYRVRGKYILSWEPRRRRKKQTNYFHSKSHFCFFNNSE